MFAHYLINHQNPDRFRILPCDTETNLSLADFGTRFLLNRFALIGAQPELLRFKFVGVRKTNFLRLSQREVMLRQRHTRSGEPESGQKQLRQYSTSAFQACVGSNQKLIPAMSRTSIRSCSSRFKPDRVSGRPATCGKTVKVAHHLLDP